MGGMACVKYGLFAFNLLFVISGLAILVVGAIIKSANFSYEDFIESDSQFSAIPLLLIIVGVIIFVVAFFGCCGALKENRCMIIMFVIFLVIIFVMELAAGICGYLMRNKVNEVLNDQLNKTMHDYTHDNTTRKTWDVVQHDLHCCGIKSPSDWKVDFPEDRVPWSCCPSSRNTTEICNMHSHDLYREGCLPKVEKNLENNVLILGGVGIGIAVVQLLVVLFSCCLVRSISKGYQTV